MKIVVAPDSFKGSLSAGEVAAAIEEGIKRVFPKVKIRKVPLADGGEGTVPALVEATGGRIREVEVTGPSGEKVKAKYGRYSLEKQKIIGKKDIKKLDKIPTQ